MRYANIRQHTRITKKEVRITRASLDKQIGKLLYTPLRPDEKENILKSLLTYVLGGAI
jgi:hypothetical protein